MKQLYTLIFILIISVNILNANNNYGSLAVEKITSGTFVLPTATITASVPAVCINGTLPLVTFTGSGGVAPYTFTYKINGGPDIITSQSTGNIVTLNVPTSTTGNFEYTLVSVKDSTNATQNQTGSVAIQVNALPVVDFTFANDNSCSGTAVQFNSNTTGSGTYTYAWNFGDGNTSTLQNPSHVFNNTNGSTTQSFNVTLTITNANGCVNSISKSISIKSPGATLNSNVDSDVFNGFPIFKVCTNDVSQIDFINTSITSSTDTNYVIDWGDTTPNFTATTFSTTSHTYSVGLWTLTFTVTGQDGCVITRIYKVFVGNNPAVGIGNPGNTNVCISSPLTFPITGTENNPPGTIYTITFNDGSAPTTFNHPPPASITHTFLKSSCGVTSSGLQNSFSATIKASNPCDVSFGYVIPIRVSEPPVANFTLPQTKVCINTQVCFTDSSTGGATATNSSCVNPKIVWSISPSTGYTLSSGTLGSDNNGSENTGTWTLGTNSICPVFSVSGTYTITMKTGNSCYIDEIVKTICVEAPPVPIFTLSTTDGCGPLSVSTTNTTDTTNSCDTTYLWDVTYTAANCGTTSSYNYISGSSTSASPVFSFENPGIYSITLKATNSCGSFTSAAQTVTVKQPPTVVVNAIATNCVNSPITPSVLVNSCSTTPNSALEYLWTFIGGTPSTSTSVTPPTVSYALPGNYSIKLDVKNECGTTSVTSNTFTINPMPIIQNETKSICNSSSFVVIPSVLTSGNVIPSGTTYSWGSPVVTGGIIGGLSGTNQTTINGTLTNPTNVVQTATYTVTPSAEGCTGTPFTVIINVSPKIIITGSHTNVSCFGNSDGTATASVTGGTVPYIYSWNTTPVQTTATLAGLAAGTYIVTVTDANSCTKSQEIIIDQPIVLNSSVSSQTDVSCFGGSNGSATVLATGGTAPYSYSWNTIPVQTSAAANGLAAGAYNVTITDSKGCSIVQPVTINQPSAVLDSSISAQTDVSCFGSNTGSATILATGGTAPYFYSWNTTPVQTTAIGSGLPAGTYNVTITDAKGCSKNQSVTISQPATGLTAAISSQTNLTCFGGNNGSATVTASGGVGGLTYSWNTIPVQTLATANGLKAGTYTVTVTDENGCSKTQQVIITQPNEIVITGLHTNVSCFGNSDGTATASVTGGTAPYIYSWNTTPVQTTATLAGLAAGTYIVTVTDANSCTKSQEIIIDQPMILNSSVSSQTDVSCFGGSNGSATVLATGGTAPYSYSWNTIPVQTSAAANGLAAGAYNVTITDSKGCSIVQPVTINQPSAVLDSSISAQTDVSCFGSNTGSATILATGGTAPYFYSWNTTPVQTTAIGSGLPAGTYNVTITDAKGCSKNQSVTITQPATGLSVAVSSQTNLTCFGGNNGSATVTASGGVGGLTYSWNTIPVQTLATANGLKAGTYTITVTDENGCSKTQQVIITQPNEIVITGLHTNVSCFGNSDGTATASVTGGTAPYIYSWNTTPVQTTAKVVGLAAGTYIVTVTDANSCTKSQEIIIDQPMVLNSSVSSKTDVSCFGGSNGSATVLATGGTAPYSYSWNTIPVQTSATANGLAAGTYTVLVTDFNGCSTSSSITITEPVGMTGTTTQTNVLCYGDNTGSAAVNTTGGIGSYSYSWNTIPVQNSSTATNLKAGIYTVTISDENNCFITKEVTITEPNGIITSISSQTNVACFGDNTGAATILASGGNGALSYSWNTIPVNTTATATGLSAGEYAVTVTDANNCSKIQKITITEPEKLLITNDLKKNISCFGNANGSIAITITGGTLNYNYTWKKNGTLFSTTEDLSNLGPGEYEVSVSDSNNCGPVTATFTITEPPILVLNLISQTNVLCFGTATGAITVDVVGGTPMQTSPGIFDYNYAWTGPNGFTSSDKNLNAIFAGTYNLTVTDDSGCSKKLSVIVTQSSEIIIKATTTPIICYGGNDASIILSITGGIAPYKIVWNTLASGLFQDNLSAGDYLITVTDSNNCVKTLNVNIPEAPIFTINPIVKQISCFGMNDGSINLNLVGGITPLTLVWSDGSKAGLTRNNLGPGSYTVTIVDSKPCTIIRTFIIQEPQKLILSANVTHAFDCDDANSGAINLLVAGGSTPFTYAWSNGATTEDLNNIPAGNYLVTVTDSRGCSKTAQYVINRQPPIVIGVETKTDFNCETKYVKQTFVAQVSGGVPPYQLTWSSGTISGVNNEMMNTNQNGTVVLGVIDNLGCTANYTFNVAIPKLGTPFFTTSSYAYSTFGSFSINDPIQFTNTATADYISTAWDFGDGSVSTEENPLHSYVKEGSYVVTQTVTYAFGCIYIHTMTLLVDKGYKLMVPNGFTPNGDGINETFKPVFIGLKSLQLDLYDTWGELIYSETGDTLHGWDGRVKKKESENGNYYYKVEATTFYGTIVNESGPFTLIK